MKNLTQILMRGGALAILTISLNATAQHLPNVGFNNWKGSCDNTWALGKKTFGSSITTANNQRPGDEPSEWNGSSVNQLNMKSTLITKESETVNDQENIYAQLTSNFVGLGSLGSNAPGYLTLGTPWVYATTSVSSADGGTFGGAAFAGYKPFGIKFKVKRTDTNDEVSVVKAYLWAGTYTSKVGSKDLSISTTQSDCDRAILGGELANSSDVITGDGKLIARLDTTITNEVNEWTEFIVRFKYLDNNSAEVADFADVVYGDNVTTPEKINVIICSGNYADRNALIKGTTLLVDDVDLVYPTATFAGQVANTDQNTADADLVWADASLVIEDYGTGSGMVTIGDVVIDGVTLTTVDGITTLAYESTLEDGSVVTLNGSLSADGKYTVRYNVTAAGSTDYTGVIFADTETAETTGIESINGSVANAIVAGGQGCVNVAGVNGTVSIYSLSGAKLAEIYVNGNASISAPKGVVIVALPGSAVKATVK